jgi:hypothetical protein
VGSLEFSVGDLKALLIRTYEEIDGARNFGSNFGSDREIRSYISQADIYPDQLLRLMQVELGEKRRAFYIDGNSTNQIWNEPILRAVVTLEVDPANVQRLIGRMALDTAKSDTTPVSEESRKSGRGYDFLNSLRPLIFSESFTFELFGYPRADGSYLIEYGEWVGTSRVFHPDFATVLPEGPLSRRSSNPHIKVEVVEELIRRAQQGG